MGYKGHPGLTNADVGNVPDENPSLRCADCGERASVETVTAEGSGWQTSQDPDVPLLCPDCRERQRRAEENHDLEAFD